MFGYYWAKIKSKILKNNEILNNFYRKQGAKIGAECLVCTPLIGEESCLVSIGNKTTVSTEVAFVTHDYSIHNLSPELINLFGKIEIGDNCFIGERSIIMYGVNICDNVIIAAGSVVTHSILEENTIYGGNPAKKIGTWEGFYSKAIEHSMSRHDLKRQVTNNPERLIVRK